MFGSFQQQCLETLFCKQHLCFQLCFPCGHKALFPGDSYDDLEIKDGGTASNTFLSIVNGTFEGDIEEKRIQLLDYCEMDTLAMVKILDKLLEI